MGKNEVGGMIVEGKEGFVKKKYSKLNISQKEIKKGDDLGMMREVIERRL